MQELVSYTERVSVTTAKRYEIQDITETVERVLLGHQVIVPVTDGRLDLGPWERVHYGEFDGRRPKKILLKAFGIGAGK